MAKGARSSATKANNRRLATNVFGPAEDARRERLSAKLLELAKQPKPESSDADMKLILDDSVDQDKEEQTTKEDAAMEVDSSSKSSSTRIGKKRIDKRKQKTSKIVFSKYSDRQAAKKKRSGK
ncbi:hypothetical protein PT974_02780 [Cladobotryum mycophilum]|uniref:DUF2423 domain-containing protein n=1 Tax=Cladobotryum mycophilum TaxID=491253 RepID=A0ABR0SZ20_9HYPO